MSKDGAVGNNTPPNLDITQTVLNHSIQSREGTKDFKDWDRMTLGTSSKFGFSMGELS